jgi:hypothetical protein
MKEISMSRLRTLSTISLLLVSSLSFSAFARDCGGSCNASNASAVMSEGLGLVVAGSMSAVAASGEVVIETVETVGESVVIGVKASAKTAAGVSKASIKLSGKAIKKVAFAAGQVLEFTAVSTGYFLVYSGKAVAFIPNEVGQALLEHEKVKP